MIRRLKTEMEYSDDLMQVLREENNRIFGKVDELNSDVQKTDFLSKPLEILRKKFQEIEQVRKVFRNQIQNLAAEQDENYMKVEDSKKDLNTLD